MAAIFPDQGVDFFLGVFPRSASAYGACSLYIGLFTSQTASAVISRTQTMADITEPTPGTGAYDRQRLSASNWGTPSTSGTGRKVSHSQVTFPTATAGWGTVNGFFVATACTSGSCVYQSNFDDQSAVTVNNGDVVKVTPSVTMSGSV
jgi:hypothetical protein